MSLTAAKRTTQIVTTGIAGMRGEENAALNALFQAIPQMGSGPQCRPEKSVVFIHQTANFALPIPVLPILEASLDLDG